MAFDTGHGATATVVGSATYSWTSIEVGSFSRPAVDTTHLGSGATRTKIAGDLTDAGTATPECAHDVSAGLVDPGDEGLTTINVPDGAGGTTAWSAQSFVESVDYPTLETDGLQTGTVTVCWKAEPSFS